MSSLVAVKESQHDEGDAEHGLVHEEKGIIVRVAEPVKNNFNNNSICYY